MNEVDFVHRGVSEDGFRDLWSTASVARVQNWMDWSMQRAMSGFGLRGWGFLIGGCELGAKGNVVWGAHLRD